MGAGVFAWVLVCLHGCMEAGCKEAEWMNGSIVTVFCVWSAEMSWKNWEELVGCSSVVLV